MTSWDHTRISQQNALKHLLRRTL